jgi:hypothetical protein
MRALLIPHPLLATAPDQAIFVDRADETNRVLKQIDASLNTLVVGEPGIGTTSFLHHVEAIVRDSARTAIFIRGDSAHDQVDLLRRLASALGAPRSAVADADAFDLLGIVGALADDQLRTIVLLDGVPTARAGHELFGRLRDDLFELPVTWVVGVRSEYEAIVTEPPADAFFSRHVRLRPLSDEVARELLERRAASDLPDGVLETALDLADGHPRRLLDLARALIVDGVSPSELRAGSAERERLLGTLTDAQLRVFSALERIGPASASDAALLAVLGVSRPRASIVLGELEAVGLATSSSERAGTGRPRKVYSLVER